MFLNLASAQQIVIDGRTQTHLQITQNVTDVTTTTIYGPNAFNSFKKFDVYAGNTVNLHVPENASNLLNLVHDRRTTIDGFLNSIQNGTIGGNIYFANPFGFVVGSQGAVNVGALSVSTPTPTFMDSFFEAGGRPSALAVERMLQGELTTRSEGVIDIDGKVQAQGDIRLNAGAVQVDGELNSGTWADGVGYAFSDLVNVEGLKSGSQVVVAASGDIEIRAAGDFVNTGVIRADGKDGRDAGDITILAGNDVSLASGSVVSSRGRGANSSGGDVYIWADNDAVFQSDARIDVSGGDVSGDGGFAEFSARNRMILDGGSINAGATEGEMGGFLFDPLALTINTHTLTTGNGYFEAADSITVAPGVIVSSRDIATPEDFSNDHHLTAASTGNSGDLTFVAPLIDIGDGAMLLAHATDSFIGGDVSLQAQAETLLSGQTAIAQIHLQNATVTGRNLSLNAAASGTDILGIAAFSGAEALIDLDGSRLSATNGDIFINADASVAATASGIPVDLLVDAALVDADARAAVTIRDSNLSDASESSLTLDNGNVTIHSSAAVTAIADAHASSDGAVSADAAVAVANVDSTALAEIRDTAVNFTGSTANTGVLQMQAENAVAADTSADGLAGGPTAAGASVAVAVVNSTTHAVLGGNTTVNGATSLALNARADTRVDTAAASTAGGAQASGDGGNASEQYLQDYDARTQEGSVDVAGALAISEVQSDVRAELSTEGNVSVAESLDITSGAATDSSATADASATGGSLGIGVAVGMNIGTTTNMAFIGDNAAVNAGGINIAAGMYSLEAVNDFKAAAKSGAGAANVGVAGALALNTVVNDTAAYIEGDTDNDQRLAIVDAGGGSVSIAALNASSSTVDAEADVKSGAGEDPPQVGVGASVGLNVAVNRTRAEVEDDVALEGIGSMALTAAADHTMTTEATGGAAGGVAVTPLAALSISVNETRAQLGAGSEVVIADGLTTSAEHKSSVATTAKGQTQGANVAVGASLGLTVAVDTVTVTTGRDVDAGGHLAFNAVSTASSRTTATASVAGGEKDDGSGTQSESGFTVDQQVADQRSFGESQGPADMEISGKAADTPSAQTDDSGGAVSVAAAIGVNIGVSTTEAYIPEERSISSSGGSLTLASVSDTDASAKAEGKQVDSGGTNVGVGAAVALNVGVAGNRAYIGDDAVVATRGVNVSARTAQIGSAEEVVNAFKAEAVSGAGAANVGVAGSLALNVVTLKNEAYIAGDRETDDNATNAAIDAGGGAVVIDSQNASSATVHAGADVKPAEGEDAAKVGVGAAIALNVGIQTTRAEVEDGVQLDNLGALTLAADSHQSMKTTAEAGAAGGVAVTPVASVSVAVNTTRARLGSGAALTLTNDDGDPEVNGQLNVGVTHLASLATEAKGQTEGDAAVGASIAVGVGLDNSVASVGRSVTSSSAGGNIDVSAVATTKTQTNAYAGAKGASENPADNGGDVDAQVSGQMNFAQSAGGGDVPTTEAPSAETQDGKKVSVAAAIGVSVISNQASAVIEDGVTVGAEGDVALKAETHTNYNTLGTGSAVADDVGIGAGVALTVTNNQTDAHIGDGADITADDIEVTAASKQNMDPEFETTLSAEAVAGASGGEVAVAGALAVVVSNNATRAFIGEGSSITAANDLGVQVDDTSRVSSKAWAGALSADQESKAGVGASFAILVSENRNQAYIGRSEEEKDQGAAATATTVSANSVSVKTTNHRVDQTSFQFDGFEALNPLNYIRSNNYYTEAMAGAASTGNTAVSGAFAINVFENRTEAYVDEKVELTTTGSRLDSSVGIETAANTETQAVAFAGSVAGGKKVGVGISNADIVNHDVTRAHIDGTATSTGSDTDVKIDARSNQDLVNVAVSGAGAGNTGVAGALGLIVSGNAADAFVGENATVQAERDVTVTAANDIFALNIAGGAAGGKTAGVGGSSAINVILNTTSAHVDQGAQVDARRETALTATATEDVATGVISGAGGGKAGVAASISVNTIKSDTRAFVGEGARINSASTYSGGDQDVRITATDDTLLVGASGGGAGGGTAGVGAAVDTGVVVKTVKAYIADDTLEDGKVATVQASDDIEIDAHSTENVVSGTLGAAGGGNTGVGGAVSVSVVANDTQAFVGSDAVVVADGNTDIQAQDETLAVLVAGGAAGGGTAGVGGSLAVTTIVNDTRAYINDGAQVTARATGVDDHGLSVRAEASEILTSIVAAGAGGGSAGVAATIGTTVVANNTEAFIGAGAKINADNTGAGDAQRVEVAASDTTTAIGIGVSGAGGGSAGVGIASMTQVISKTTRAYTKDATGVDPTVIKATEGVTLSAGNTDNLINLVVGAAGGGSAGVGGTLGVAVVSNTTDAHLGADTHVTVDATEGSIAVRADSDTNLGPLEAADSGTQATLEDLMYASKIRTYDEQIAEAQAAGDTARVEQLETEKAELQAEEAGRKEQAAELALGGMVAISAAGGGAAGIGGAITAAVIANDTRAYVGDNAELNAHGVTAVQAASEETIGTLTIAGAGGGSAGVAGAISVKVVDSETRVYTGQDVKINQDPAYRDSAQTVDIGAQDTMTLIGVSGAGAGGGAAGVGAGADISVVFNRTEASVGSGSQISADTVNVSATADKYLNSFAASGAGGGAAGVAGSASVINVGAFFDSEATEGLEGSKENPDGSTETVRTQDEVDGQMSDTSGLDMLGGTESEHGSEDVVAAKTRTDEEVGGAQVGSYFAASGDPGIELNHTRAHIDGGAIVSAQRVSVFAQDRTQAIQLTGSGSGGGAAGVAGTLGVVLINDKAQAYIADEAEVHGEELISVKADTEEDIYHLAVTGSGAGAAGVSGSLTVNVVESDTDAYIGGAYINQDASGNTSAGRSVEVKADSSTDIVNVAGSFSGAGAAAVGGVLATNVMTKETRAFIGRGAKVYAQENVDVSADSRENVINGALSIRGAGAAAVGGVLGVNVIANTTEALIGEDEVKAQSVDEAAEVVSDGNVKVTAVDDSLIVNVVAAGNGAGAAGVGGSLGVNVLSSRTRAAVSDYALVHAKGRAAGVTVYTGALGDPQGHASNLPEGQDGSVDFDKDGVADGSVDGTPAFNITAAGGESGDDTAESFSADQAGVGDDKDAVTLGLGAREESAADYKGLAVTAMGNEKVVTATLGVSGAGAAAVTGAASVNVIATDTEASIGDHATIYGAVPDSIDPNRLDAGSVRVQAADNTFMVQTAGTVAGAGAAAVSGSANVGIVSKQTEAFIGASTVEAQNVQVTATSSDDIYNVTANVSVAGAAGVGGAVGVSYINNRTLAHLDAGSDVAADGDLEVIARNDTFLNLDTVSGAAGGFAGVSGAASIAIIENSAEAYVESAPDQANAAEINATGTTKVEADSREEVLTATVAGAASGVAGVAGGVSVKVVQSEATASIGDYAQVNQNTAYDTLGQQVVVSAVDTVDLSGGAGAGSYGGVAGVGGSADINIIRNTTTASLSDATRVNARDDVLVAAESTKRVDSIVATLSGGGAVGIGGAVSVVSIGAALDKDSQDSLKDSGGGSGNTAGFVDSQMSKDGVTDYLGDAGAEGDFEFSGHVQDDISGDDGANARIAGLNASENINASPDNANDKTQALIGSGAQVTAGRDIRVQAHTATHLGIISGGVGIGGLGAGGGVGIATLNNHTEAVVQQGAVLNAGLEADDVIRVSATDDVIDSTVTAFAGGAGLVGLGAAVAYLDNQDSAEAHIEDNAQIESGERLEIEAVLNSRTTAEAYGGSAGVVGAMGSVARDTTGGFARAHLGSTQAGPNEGVQVGQTNGKQVDHLAVTATADNTSTAYAKGGAAGLGALNYADAASRVNPQVAAYSGNYAQIATQESILVKGQATSRSTAEALGVTIGGVSVGASMAASTVKPVMTSAIGSNNRIDTGSLSVVSLHDGYANADAFAASGGLYGGTGSDADAEAAALVGTYIAGGQDADITAKEVIVDGQVGQSADAAADGYAGGLLGVGASLSDAKTDGINQVHVDDARIKVLVDDTRISSGNLSIRAHTDDHAAAYTQSGAGGIAAGSGSIAKATSGSKTDAYLGSGADITAAQDLSISALSEIDVTARADGVNAGGLAVGVSEATAEATPEVSGGIRSGDSEATGAKLQAGNVTIVSRQTGNTEAKSTAATGALVGVSATEANASTAAVVKAEVGDYTVVDVDGNLTVRADAANAVRSDASGFTFGLAAFGGNAAKAATSGETTAYVGRQVSVTAGDPLNLDNDEGNVTVDAYAVNDTFAKSRAGAGGGIAGVTTKAETIQDNLTRAFVADSGVDNTNRLAAARDIRIRAEARSLFNAESDSTSAGLVGVSGGRLKNTIKSTVSAFIGKNTALDAARDIGVQAINRTLKTDIGYNMTSGAGGLVGASAGKSESTITNDTEAYIAGNDAGSSQRITSGQDVTVSAQNDVFARDRGKLSTGGLIGIADVQSAIVNSNRARASVGNRSDIDAGRDFNLTSSTDADVQAATYTHTWGLAASGDGTARVKVTADNDTRIEAALIHAGRDINVAAGRNADGLENNLRARAEARSYVQGGIPLSDVNAYAELFDFNDLGIAGGAALSAERDIAVGAFKGSPFVQGYAKAKKRSYLLFGIPITVYSDGDRLSHKQTSDTVTIDGSLEAGLQSKKALHIDADQEVLAGSDIGYTFETHVDEYQELEARIADLNARLEALTTTDSQGKPQVADADKPEYAALSIEKSRYEARQAEITTERDTNSEYAYFDRFVVDDTRTGSGDINLNGTLGGSGTLKAPGNDFRIDIENNSLAYLEINDLEIPRDSLSRITLNGRTIQSHATLNLDFGSSSTPTIRVENTYNPDLYNDPDPQPYSDILLRGDIKNYLGDVTVINQSGSIESLGDIIGSEVRIFAPKGNITQNYTPGLSDVENRIAGNNIIISGEVLNIKGLIQSGFPERTVVIPDFDPASLGADNVIMTNQPLDNPNQIGAVWDPESETIRLSRATITGGNVELFGEIVSDVGGSGRIQVVDGYGKIEIVNNSKYDIVVNKLDNSRQIHARVKITDTGKLSTTDSRFATVTEIEAAADGQNLNVWEYGVDLVENPSSGEFEIVELDRPADPDNRTGRDLLYNTRDGARYIRWGDDVVYTDRDDVSELFSALPWWENFWLSWFGLNSNEDKTARVWELYGRDADRDFPIAFGGQSTGTVDIYGNTSADIFLNASILTDNGRVNIHNQGGGIYALNDNGQILARDIELFAGNGDIGSATQAINIDSLGGPLTAAAAGMINVKELQGDLLIGQVHAGGDVILYADGGISDPADNMPGVTGRGVSLTALNGGIGSADNPVIIDSTPTYDAAGSVNGGMVSADANGDIHLTEHSGDLLVDRIASAAGDVFLTVPGGIEDYNFNEVLDEDTADELAGLWEDLDLTAEGMAQAIADYKTLKKNEYRAQHRLNDNDTPDNYLDDEYDDTYDPFYEYVLTPEEVASFNDGVWTSEELVFAKNINTLPDIGDDGKTVKTETFIEEANIAGRNLYITAGGGLGRHLDDEVITQADILAGDITREQKILIAQAEKDDLSYDGDNLVVSQKLDVDVTATGVVDIQAQDFVYLGSETDVNIDRIASATSDIRLKIYGNIVNAATSPEQANLAAEDVILEASNGAIGSFGAPLALDLRTGGTLTARALEEIFIEEIAGDLRVDYIFSRNGSIDLRLAEPGTALQIGDAFVPQSMTLQADAVYVDNLTHTSAEEILHVSLSGSAGGLADYAEVYAASQTGITFDRLLAQYLLLNAQVDDLLLYNVRIGARAEISNGLYDVIVNNVDKRLQPSDAQLYMPNDPFFLLFSGERLLWTDAYIVDYNSEFILNYASTENSITRADPKLLSLTGTDDELRTYEHLWYLWTRLTTADEPGGHTPVAYRSDDLGIEVLHSISDEEEMELDW